MSDVLIRPGHDQAAVGIVKNLEIIVENGAIRTSAGPGSGAEAGLASTGTAVAGSTSVLKAAAGNFYGATCCSTGAAGYLMLFDAASAPADGTVTPRKVWPVAAGGGIEIGYPVPLRMTVGAVLVFSSTGPFTKTAANAFISGEAL